MVQSGYGPCPASHLSHTQSDHGRVRGNLPQVTSPLGENIPTSMTPAHVDDSLTMEGEVEWVVRTLRGHRSGGPSWMRANHLQEWLQEHRVAEAVAEERGTKEGGEEGAER